MMLKSLEASCKVWFAFDNGEGIGFVSAVSDRVHCAFVTYLEVLPDYQGQGIGSELMQKLEESLSHLYAIVLQCGNNVIPFYKKLGYMQGNAMYKRFNTNMS